MIASIILFKVWQDICQQVQEPILLADIDVSYWKCVHHTWKLSVNKRTSYCGFCTVCQIRCVPKGLSSQTYNSIVCKEVWLASSPFVNWCLFSEVRRKISSPLHWIDPDPQNGTATSSMIDRILHLITLQQGAVYCRTWFTYFIDSLSSTHTANCMSFLNLLHTYRFWLVAQKMS